MKTIQAVDLFCGAGGASVGLRRACEALGLRFKLLAINHWDTAIKTHMLNHPDVEHRCESIESVKPRQAVPGGRVQLLLAGPSCVHHSKARGGRPKHEQERASANRILDWLDELFVENLLVENVAEFQDWGPLDGDGHPIESRKGVLFQAWIGSIEARGYRVEWHVINAADFGDPQSRRRIWVMARRGNRRPNWPTPTHSASGGRTLFNGTRRWVGAESVVDLTLPSKSIFNRKKPLAEATLRRIHEGMVKYGWPKPFLVVLRRHMSARGLEEPLPTISAGGQHIALVQPFVIGQQSGSAPRSVDEPLPTIATAGAISVVQPFMVPMFGEREGQTPRTHGLDDPLPTITASKGGPALVQAFISPYNGNSTPSLLGAPLPTVTAAERLSLVQPGEPYDTLFRMLTPGELSAGQGFPRGYRFEGTQEDQVRQIGNAWPCATAQALCFAVLERYAEARAPRRIEAAG